MFENVLSKCKIGNVEIKNRFVMPAMGSMHGSPGGGVSDSLVAYFAARASGGFGLIMTEAAGVDPPGYLGQGQFNAASDDAIPGLKKLADGIHAEGAKVFLQLHHAGRWAMRRSPDEPAVSSSAIPWHLRDEVVRELTTEEVYEIIEKYGDAALRARKAGYDGVELHGAHGYLITQFTSPYINRRFDEFGGDIAGRSRFPCEIIKNIKQKCGDDFPVCVRIGGDEKVDGSMMVNETRVMAKLLEKAGADALNVSVGLLSAFGDKDLALASYRTPMGFNTYVTEELKQSIQIPLIAVGRLTDPSMLDAVIEDGMADFVGLGRGSLADPELPLKLYEGRINEIVPCIGCLTNCVDITSPRKEGKFPWGRCSLNPFSGNETLMAITPADKKKTVVIVGAGVAGLEAAWICAARGHKVIVLEKAAKQGGQAYIAGVPPSKQGFSLVIRYMTTMCKKHEVDIRFNTEATPEMILALNPDEVILSTGAIPIGLNIPNDGIEVVQATDLLAGKIVSGKKPLVIGGGLVGLETTDFLLTQMRSVTIVEMMNTVGEDFVLKNVMKEDFIKYLLDSGVKIMTSTKAMRFTKDGAICSTPDGEITLSGYDMVVLAVGSKSYNPLESELIGKVPGIHVIGDAKETRLIKDAVMEAAELAVGI